VQGRVIGAAAGASILEHPDVRRMILHMRSHVEAMRLLAYRTAVAIDTQDSGLADLLTPVTKAWCTDVGSEVAKLAVQVVGGMGYIRETGVEQHERDVRIAAIYEGTNGIQAIDLVGRKLNLDGGAPVKDLLTDIESTAAVAGGRIGERLTAAVRALAEATEWLQTRWTEDPRQALAGATPYLRMFGTTTAGWLLARQAIIARPGAADDPFLAAKVTSAGFFCDQIVPQVGGLLPSVVAGAADLDAIPAELL
jgi:hypothetical protein